MDNAPKGETGARGAAAPFHALSPAEVASAIGAGAGGGLDEREAAARLLRDGRNRLLEAARPSLAARFLAQVSDTTVLALLAAAAIAATLGWLGPLEPGQGALERYGDSLAILAIVVLNAVLGLLQEKRAERALDALKRMTAPNARVLRLGADGVGAVREVPADEVVQGDLLLLETGDRVAADVRLTEAAGLEIEEAALTGESLPVAKQPLDPCPADAPLAERATMAFTATQVVRGRGRGLVVATGMRTELGSIAGMLAAVDDEETPLERDLARFGNQVVIGCVVVSAVVFAVGLGMAIAHGRHLGAAARELFLVAVALAVAAIPEGLPAITTIVLALGTQRMAKRNALVRRLPAVETLGCTQVICTDKTGTITQNAMRARRLRNGGALYEIEFDGADDPLRLVEDGGVEPAARERDLRLALWAAGHVTGARLVDDGAGGVRSEGDPTDGALLILSARAAKARGPLRDTGPLAPLRPALEAEQPFTSERRMASVTLSVEGRARSYVRGAPEAILARSTTLRRAGRAEPLDAAARAAIEAEAARWAGEAMRVIALAYREGKDDPERELTFLGLVGIVDPPRPEVARAIGEAQAAGIRTMLITGDHPATARAIAREVGLLDERDGDDAILSGAALDAMSDGDLALRIDRVRVVARATAAHKLRLVEALKARGLVCAMTGDGVNDAPAVKAASIGVAMGKAGTDVTREAADLVLADDNYATIVAAVEEGRAIYENIRKFVFFLLSSNAGIVLVVLFASLFGWHSPLAPIQILWINLITNGLPALALGVDARDADQMRRGPRPPGSPILDRGEYVEMLVVGAVMAVTALWAFHAALGGAAADEVALDPSELFRVDRARTICFTILALGPLLHAFNCRSKTKSLFAVGVFTNRALWSAIAIGCALQAVTVVVPWLRPLFRTVPVSALGASGAIWIAAMSLLPFVLGELVKLARALGSRARGN